MKAGVSLVVGLVVGLTIAALTNAAIYSPHDLVWPPNLTGFWGLFYGAWASVIAFGIILMLANRGVPRVRRVGRLIAAIALGLFGFTVVGWIGVWGFSPFSLEGAWIYPLAFAALAASFLLFRGWRRGPTDNGKASLDLYR